MATFDAQLAGYESRFVDANGIKTHYIESGTGEPLILIHGGGPGADGYGNWQGCLPAFAQEYHALAVDMLGFGRTDKPDPTTFTYSQDARTNHMIAFIEALDAGPVSLIGNSMGGITSLGVAMQRPDLVKKLVLMGPAGIKTSEVPAALGPLMSYDGSVEGMRKVIDVLTHAEFKMDDGMLQYRVDLSNQPATKKALGATMQWVKSQHGLYFEDDLIRQVKTPTLVVGGKDDPIVTPDQIYKLLALLENSRGYVIPHCGHWVMIEYPEEFTRISTGFLKQ